MSGLKIKRKIEDVEVTFSVSDDELVEYVSKKPLDERAVLLRKLAGKDIDSLLPLGLIGNMLKNYK
jgi:hypothetical protein